MNSRDGFFFAALLLVSACGGPGDTTAGQTESGSTGGPGTSTTDSTSTSTTTTGDNSGTGTEGMTSEPTTAGPTSTTSTSTSGPSTLTDPMETTSTSTSGTSDPSGSSSTGTTEPVDDTMGSSTGGSSTSTTGPDCVPSPEVCNDLDDDCDDIVDNVDVGGDGICDCLNIAIFGNKGANPNAQFEAWLEAQGTQVDRIQINNVPLDQATLDKYDIIILDRLIRTYTPQEAALVDGWVGNGGGLMSMTGYTGGPNDVNFPNSIIGLAGLTYNNSMGIINGPVTNWQPHPISDGITSVTFLGGFYINVQNDGVGMNTTVATLNPGPVAVAQVRKGGKLFIWGDEWIEFDSEWQNMAQIKKLWANILGWLAPMNFCTLPQ